MKNYVRNNYADCKAVAIIAGNINERNAITVAKNFFRQISLAGPYHDNALYLRRTVSFPKPSNLLVTVPAVYSQENAILVVYQIGRLSLQDQMTFSGLNLNGFNPIWALLLKWLIRLHVMNASISLEPSVNLVIRFVAPWFRIRAGSDHMCEYLFYLRTHTHSV